MQAPTKSRAEYEAERLQTRTWGIEHMPQNTYESDLSHAGRSPFEKTGKFWKHNELFLKSIEQSEQRWRERGVEWRIGFEFEFYFAPREKLIPKAKRHVSTTKPKRMNTGELDPNYKTNRTELLKRLHDYYLDKIASEENDAKRRYWQKRLVEVNSGKLETEQLIIRELKDIAMPGAFAFMANSYDDGTPIRATDDYGSELFGVMELRFAPTSPMQAVAQFHEAVEFLAQSANKYGMDFTPDSMVHLHVSAHETDTGETITNIENDAQRPRYHNMMQGVYGALQDGHMLTQHNQPGKTPNNGVAETKLMALRVLANRFEWRVGDSNPPHIAKSIALILGGALYGEEHQGEELPAVEEQIQAYVYREGTSEGLGQFLDNAIIRKNPDGSHSLEFAVQILTAYTLSVTHRLMRELTGSRCDDLVAFKSGYPINLQKYQRIYDVIKKIELIEIQPEIWMVDMEALQAKLSGALNEGVLNEKTMRRTLAFFESVVVESDGIGFYAAGEPFPRSKKKARNAFQNSAVMEGVFGEENVDKLAKK